LIGVVHHHQDYHIQGVQEEVVNHFEIGGFGNHLAHTGLDICHNKHAGYSDHDPILGSEMLMMFK
jgi:hypothetical protein